MLCVATEKKVDFRPLAGIDGEPEGKVRMSSTLALKKHMKSLHCFRLVSLCAWVRCLISCKKKMGKLLALNKTILRFYNLRNFEIGF